MKLINLICASLNLFLGVYGIYSEFWPFTIALNFAAALSCALVFLDLEKNDHSDLPR